MSEYARLVSLVMVSASIFFAYAAAWNLFAITALISVVIPLWVMGIASMRGLTLIERKAENQD